MGNIKSILPLWLLNVGVITATSFGDALNLAEQILKIALILLTGFYTIKIGRKKLQEKREKETDLF